MPKARKRKAIYSANDGDLGAVTLYGHEVPHVLRCSPSEGWLEKAVCDIDGHFVIDREKAEVVAVRIHGDVKYLAGGVD